MLAPSSKSMGHREIICAGLAEGTSVVDNISMSKDIEATCRCLRALGVTIEDVASKFAGRSALKVTGTGKLRASEAGADCGESGSTLRFFIPLGALLGEAFTFTGHGKLVSRPLNAYYDIFEKQGLQYTTAEEGHLPLTVNGRLQAGLYQLPGNVSSQYVSGLLFALPLLENDSVIEITSELESSAYVDMTLSCLKKYGIEIVNENDAHRRYLVRGGQKYQAMDSNIEGDWYKRFPQTLSLLRPVPLIHTELLSVLHWYLLVILTKQIARIFCYRADTKIHNFKEQSFLCQPLYGVQHKTNTFLLRGDIGKYFRMLLLRYGKVEVTLEFRLIRIAMRMDYLCLGTVIYRVSGINCLCCI